MKFKIVAAPWALLVLAALGSGAPSVARADSWPQGKVIKLVNPYAPGGSTERVVRMVAQHLTETLKQSVIVENRPGAGSNIGNQAVAQAAPDGYTLLNGTSSLAINLSLYSKIAYDPVRDLAPVILLTQSPNVLAVHPSLPVKSVADLIAYARANPGKLNYGSSGNGATNHLAMEKFKTDAGLAIVHIPYKGGGPAVADLIAGQIQVLFNPPSSLMPHHANGRLRALAVSSQQRLAGLDLPTIDESGLKGFESSVWFALFAPAGTPRPIVDRINADINQMLKEASIRDQLLKSGLIPMGGTPEDLGRLLREEIQTWAKVIKASGAKID
jgi:tripartite-type tricarboxylate transporter receptor subunit TctC